MPNIHNGTVDSIKSHARESTIKMYILHIFLMWILIKFALQI